MATRITPHQVQTAFRVLAQKLGRSTAASIDDPAATIPGYWWLSYQPHYGYVVEARAADGRVIRPLRAVTLEARPMYHALAFAISLVDTLPPPEPVLPDECWAADEWAAAGLAFLDGSRSPR